MSNYNPSTRNAVSEINSGLRVNTGTLAATTYLLTGGVQNEIFTVSGRILLLQLYAEVVTALSAHACQLLFNATWTTPSIAVQPLCGKCASISGLAAGRRIVWVGGAVATAAVITATAGISDVTCVTPHIIGGDSFVGTIGTLSSDASCNSGSIKVYAHYVPYSEGAYMQALV